MSVWEYRGAMSGIPWAPEACTLPTVDRPVRQAEFSWLLAQAEMIRVDQTTLRLRLPPETAATAADLIVRKTCCCSFFTFALIHRGGTAAGRDRARCARGRARRDGEGIAKISGRLVPRSVSW